MVPESKGTIVSGRSCQVLLLISYTKNSQIAGWGTGDPTFCDGNDGALDVPSSV